MSSPHGATWRSGYATVCKTVYSGSIPDVASTFAINDLGLVPASVFRPRNGSADTPRQPGRMGSSHDRSMKHAMGDGASHAVQPIQ